MPDGRISLEHLEENEIDQGDWDGRVDIAAAYRLIGYDG